MLKGVSTWSLNSADELAKVQEKIRAPGGERQLGIFCQRLLGPKAMKLSPEVNLIAVATICRRWSASAMPTASSPSSAARLPTSRTWRWAGWPTPST